MKQTLVFFIFIIINFNVNAAKKSANNFTAEELNVELSLPYKELLEEVDYSFQSTDENIDINIKLLNKDEICSDESKLLLAAILYKFERKKYSESLKFFLNDYYDFIDLNKKSVLYFEFLTNGFYANIKARILDTCFFKLKIKKLNEYYHLHQESNHQLYEQLFEKYYKDIRHKMRNANFAEKIFLSSNNQVLALLSVEELIGNSYSNTISKRILLLRKTNTNKFTIDWGDYYALMIGNDKYLDEMLVDLDSPLNDIELLSSTLVSKYLFTKENIKILKNATRADILDTLFEYRELDKYNNNKNLLIYYAGHGDIDEIDENNIEGYWLPSDARYEKKSSWISNNTIKQELKALPFRHIIIIADSCFSGTLTALKSSSINEIPKDMEARKRWLENKNKLYARVALTSGNIDEVPDTIDNNKNSQFAIALNNALLRNDDILLSSKLHDDVIEEIQYSGYYLQDPTYGGIVNAKHSSGGNFIFVPSD